MNIDEAYRICHRIINKHSKTFSKAFSVLPLKRRQAVWAIYAFCRKVDDIVDEGISPHSELTLFEESFHAFLRGELPLVDPEWIALNDVFKTFAMDPEPFYDMIKGQRTDLSKNRYSSLEEVEEYSYYVASTVGLMLLPVLSPKNHKILRSSGIALGRAMQLTNILRDVGEDLDRDRIYLPEDLLWYYQITEADLINGIVDDRFIAVWESVATRAEELYIEAFKDIHLYPLDARAAVHGAGLMYRAILNAVRKNKYDVFTKRSYVTERDKQEIRTQLEV